MLFMKKRGLSDVITTVLIILLVLAAVVIIWSFVKPAIQSGAGKVSGGCVELDLTIDSCAAGTAVAPSGAVTVTRGADGATLDEVVFVYTIGTTTVRNDTGLTVAPLGKLSYTPTGLSGPPTDVSVTGKIKTEAGEQILCPVTAVKATCT